MKINKLLCTTTIIFLFSLTQLFSQQTYVSAENKFSSLVDTKLLKTGEIVLLEKYRYCNLARVKLLDTNGSVETVHTEGTLIFHSFNELPDNNWILLLITDATDDVPIPDKLTIIQFIDGQYTINSIEENMTSIPLREIKYSSVINSSELVLSTINEVYFTDFQISNVSSIETTNNLEFLKSHTPVAGTLYFKYSNDNIIYFTENKFQAIESGPNVDLTFQNFHLLGSYSIFQYDEEIWSIDESNNFEYIEQNNTIYDFSQQGQNLRYYTLSDEDILTFNKLDIDDNGELRIDNFQIDISEDQQPPKLFWDGDFKGSSSYFVPLPEDQYDDDYRGINYELNYNLEDNDLSTQYLNMSIDNIDYTATLDSTLLSNGHFLYYANIDMEITLMNHSDEAIENVYLHSAAFEGINCAHNFLRIDPINMIIPANESIIVNAEYKMLKFSNINYLQHPLCVYVIGANNKPDEDFNDNIYCLPLSEFTSTIDEFTLNKLNIFPNPALDLVYVENEIPQTTFQVYSIQGKLVAIWEKKKEGDSFDTSMLSKGTYIVIDKKSNSQSLFTKI